jgi:hypothetical protein
MTSNNAANCNTTLPSTPTPQTSKEVIAANVKLLIEPLEAGHSEGLTACLTAMGRFHNYSFGKFWRSHGRGQTLLALQVCMVQPSRPQGFQGTEGYPHSCPADRKPQEEGHRSHQQRPRRSQ